MEGQDILTENFIQEDNMMELKILWTVEGIEALYRYANERYKESKMVINTSSLDDFVNSIGYFELQANALTGKFNKFSGQQLNPSVFGKSFTKYIKENPDCDIVKVNKKNGVMYTRSNPNRINSKQKSSRGSITPTTPPSPIVSPPQQSIESMTGSMTPGSMTTTITTPSPSISLPIMYDPLTDAIHYPEGIYPKDTQIVIPTNIIPTSNVKATPFRLNIIR